MWAARTYKPHCRGKTRLYLFTEWLSSEPEQLEPRMRAFARLTLENGFDGVDVHEAVNFERATTWPILGRFHGWLRGEPINGAAAVAGGH